MNLMDNVTSETKDKYEGSYNKVLEESRVMVEETELYPLLAEYASLVDVLVELERDADTLKENYTTHLEERKLEIMEEYSIKATPAKQKAREELKMEEKALCDVERDITYCSHQKKIIDYAIRYKINHDGGEKR